MYFDLAALLHFFCNFFYSIALQSQFDSYIQFAPGKLRDLHEILLMQKFALPLDSIVKFHFVHISGELPLKSCARLDHYLIDFNVGNRLLIIVEEKAKSLLTKEPMIIPLTLNLTYPSFKSSYNYTCIPSFHLATCSTLPR